jgi:fumarylacetoacetase
VPNDSWIPVPDGSDFPATALPYGLVTYPDSDGRHLAVPVGDHVLDLAAIAAFGLLDGIVDDPTEVFGAPVLNPLLASGKQVWTDLRARLTELVTDESYRAQVEPELVRRSETTNHLPFEVADYVDFYSSEQHALNVSQMFRPESPQLPVNWKHLPIGYHGRSGTVVVSGTPIERPRGQRKPPDSDAPVFGPSQRLDIEAEVGFVVGTPSDLGSSVDAAQLTDHVFGVVLVNDWSARDIQAWEYVPLGPFLGKSFATSVSPWVVPLAALAAARVPLPHQAPPVAEYLQDRDPWCLDLSLEVALNGEVVSRPPFSTQYWSPGQQLAHLTVNGASLRTGDLYASGTVTGPDRGQRGSLLELSWGGAEPFTLSDGKPRSFLEDGDTVSITARAPGPAGTTIGFGSVVGTVVNAGETE